MQNQWKKFFDCVEEGEPLIEITDQEYLTTKRLLQFGMWACRDCGNLMPVESNFCKECGQEKFIVTEVKVKAGEEKIPQRHKSNGKLNEKDFDKNFIDALARVRNTKADSIGEKELKKEMKKEQKLKVVHKKIA